MNAFSKLCNEKLQYSDRMSLNIYYNMFLLVYILFRPPHMSHIRHLYNMDMSFWHLWHVTGLHHSALTWYATANY